MGLRRAKNGCQLLVTKQLAACVDELVEFMR